MICLFVDEDDVTQATTTTFDELLDDTIGIGKYKNKTFNWVLDYDISYIEWMLTPLPSDGRTMMIKKHHQLLVLNREKLSEKCKQTRERNNTIYDADYEVQFIYKNKICKGRITEIEPSDRDNYDEYMLCHTKVKIIFDFAENDCSYLKGHTITRLYQDLLINGNQYDPPPLRFLYIKYGIDIDTLEVFQI